MQKKNGFTLIEILISVSIVALLTGIGVSVYANSQLVARDAKRKQDMKTMQVALELFYNKFGHYPTYGGSGIGVETDSSFICNPSTDYLELLKYENDPPKKNPAANITDYISAMAVDPINDCTYHYSFHTHPQALLTSGGSTYYLLCTTLENPNDPDYNNYDPTRFSAGHNYCVYSPNWPNSY